VAPPAHDDWPITGIDVSEAERWTRVKEIFDAVVAGRVEDRAVLVRDMCGDDRALQAEVESLLAADAHNGSVFDPSVDRDMRGRVFSAVAGVLDHQTPALTPGERFGPYEITGLLGAGGMGLVYRVRDTTLGRDVALKILPDLWMANPDRRARFEREARLLASLNHPNIGSIYGVHESEPSPGSGMAVKALVLELVEGETLADRIALHSQPSASRRGMPIDDVVSLASQVIEGLEAAHECGIVHRDLKPANIKITPSGRVKLLDFGLARAMSGTDSGPQIAHSPTNTVGGTQDGVLLGTAPYMSPEQARGRPADKRADIWAFGCVLHEMLTGSPAFTGDGVAEVLANVIKTEPDWTALPADTPAALRQCLKGCLQKDLRHRFHDIADVRLGMEGAFEQPTRDNDSTQRSERSYARLAYAGWATALVAIAGALAIVASGPDAPAEVAETRLEIVTPPAVDPLSFAISPDGRSVVFQAEQDPPRLWLRPLASQETRALMGTEGATSPFWSPDSRSVGFFASGVLKRIDLENGFVRTVAPVISPRGAAWHPNGTILIGNGLGPLNSVPASGGTMKPATQLLPAQTDQRYPQFLPAGDRFLLFATGAPEVRGLYLGSLSDQGLRRVTDRELAFAFMPPGHVLLARHGALWARRLTRDFTSVEGDLAAVAPKVLVHAFLVGFGAISASSTGSIAFRSSAKTTQLVWLDRIGKSVSTLGRSDDSQMMLQRLSSDGRAVLVERKVDGNRDVWVIDVEHAVPRRLTFDDGDDGVAIFSPDGSRVVHATGGNREFFEVHERRVDGTGTSTLLLPSVSDYKQPQDWSADGRYILYRLQTLENFDLWALPLFGDRKPIEVTRTPFEEASGRFSPDGRWVAYQSTETGRSEVWIQPFLGPGPRSQISLDGGTLPRWRRDGGELFYLTPERRLVAVSVSQRGSRLVTGPPRALFTLPTTSPYEPSPDGQRFLVTAVVSEASPITVILNWKAPIR
jgi:serine/threonine protein kinase